MSAQDHPAGFRVIVVGGGVAALETVLALGELAPGLTRTTVVAPNADFAYRPMTVAEPFGYEDARRYPLEPIVREAGAELIDDTLEWIEPARRAIHTRSGLELRYDALVLALGAHATSRYRNAITIDDRHMVQALGGLIEDIEAGRVARVAFIAPGRMAWPMPLYELALLTAGRASELGVELSITIVTPEERPLGVFGGEASAAVEALLEQAGIETIASAHAEVPSATEVVINPGDRSLHVDRVVALPELYGPSVRGIPLGEHGFIAVDRHGRVRALEDVYAAGDATDLPIKHGGLSCQQADAVARSIAARAGAAVEPEPLDAVVRGMLTTSGEPLFLTAHLAGGRGFRTEVSRSPGSSQPAKIAARYLSPCLTRLDSARAAA